MHDHDDIHDDEQPTPVTASPQGDGDPRPLRDAAPLPAETERPEHEADLVLA